MPAIVPAVAAWAGAAASLASAGAAVYQATKDTDTPPGPKTDPSDLIRSQAEAARLLKKKGRSAGLLGGSDAMSAPAAPTGGAKQLLGQ